MTSYAQTTQLADHLGSKLIGFDNTNVYDKLKGLPVSLAEFSGSTVAALNSAMFQFSMAGGGFLFIPPGLYSLASAELSTPILIPSNVFLECAGAQFTITGSGYIGSVFRSVNASNIIIRNLQVYGNSLAVADGSSGAFYNFVQDTSGTGCENIELDNIRLQNFAAERWISFVNSSATAKTIRNVRLNNISAFSASGNNLGGASIGIGSSVVMLYGNTAPILDVEITNLYVDATYIKCGVTIFHAVQNVVFNSPHVINAGLTGTSDDKGAYAINVYGAPGELTDITINNPVITAPRSCGIYIRGALRVAINKPFISGQTDVNNGTLPKGAIASDGSSYFTVYGGLLSGNVFDFMAAADTTQTTFNAVLDGVTTLGASNASITINPTTGSGSPDTFHMRNCVIDSNANAVSISNNQAASARNLKNLLIHGCRITARSGTGIQLNPNGSAICANYRILDTHIIATNRGIDVDSATGDLHIDNVIIEDYGASLLTYGLTALAFPQIHLGNLLVRNMGTGYATRTDGANGTITNLRTYNVTNGCSPSSLGMIAPTLTGTQGWFVQNLNPVEAGAAASKYVNTGWRYTTAWLQQRTLTGN